MLLFQQIEDLAYKHTDARRTIGEFLLAKKSRVREYNMQQIALMSQAPNLYVGELFRRKMATIGKNVLITESDLGLLAHLLHKEDCAILISYSGNSERRLPLKVIPILEEAGVPIIAITGMGTICCGSTPPVCFPCPAGNGCIPRSATSPLKNPSTLF